MFGNFNNMREIGQNVKNASEQMEDKKSWLDECIVAEKI